MGSRRYVQHPHAPSGVRRLRVWFEMVSVIAELKKRQPLPFEAQAERIFATLKPTYHETESAVIRATLLKPRLMLCVRSAACCCERRLILFAETLSILGAQSEDRHFHSAAVALLEDDFAFVDFDECGFDLKFTRAVFPGAPLFAGQL